MYETKMAMYIISGCTCLEYRYNASYDGNYPTSDVQ